MFILQSDYGDVACVAVARPLCEENVFETAEPLQDVLGIDCYSRTILLDLGNLQLIDSSGFAWLVKHQKRMRQHGGQFILHSASPWLGQTLARLKMDLLFRITTDRESAVRLARSNRHALERDAPIAPGMR